MTLRLTRQRWLQLAFAASIGGAVALVTRSFLRRDPFPPVPPGTQLRLAGAAQLAPGTARTFQLAGRPALLLRKPSGELTALDAVCTHRACVVQAQPAAMRIQCPCHRGTYDLDGERMSGPPERALRRYGVREDAADVVVTG